LGPCKKAYENKKKNAEELYSKGNNYHISDTNKANEDYHKRAIRGISHLEKKNNYFEGKDYRINNNPYNNSQKNNGRFSNIIKYIIQIKINLYQIKKLKILKISNN
jgi:hypothetical protein